MSTLTPSNTPISVLHIGKYFPPHVGGMETYLRDLMVASTALGVTSAALVHQSKLGLHSSEEQLSIDGTEIRITRAATWLRLLFTPISPTFPWLLHRLIRRVQPEILHLHLPNPSAFWALFLPSALRLPWVIHWQSDVLTPKSNALLKIAYQFYRPFESALIKRAKKIIVTSPPYLNTSKPLASVRGQCEVIPLGIADRFSDALPAVIPEQQLTEQSGTSKTCEPLKVLAIGRLTHYKGFDVLLRAIAQTADITLDLVGSGDQEAALRDLTQSLGIAERVCFHGSLDDAAKNDLLLACDCFCLPSTDRTESFGVVLLEAMSAAKACVVSDVAGSGMSWVVNHRDTGLITRSGDAVTLASALCELRDDRHLAVRLGKHSRREFQTRFTIEVSARAVHSAYRQISPLRP